MSRTRGLYSTGVALGCAPGVWPAKERFSRLATDLANERTLLAWTARPSSLQRSLRGRSGDCIVSGAAAIELFWVGAALVAVSVVPALAVVAGAIGGCC